MLLLSTLPALFSSGVLADWGGRKVPVYLGCLQERFLLCLFFCLVLCLNWAKLPASSMASFLSPTLWLNEATDAQAINYIGELFLDFFFFLSSSPPSQSRIGQNFLSPPIALGIGTLLARALEYCSWTLPEFYGVHGMNNSLCWS